MIMNNFINIEDYDASIHREILDALLRKESPTYDPQIVEICEDRAVSEMRGYHIFTQHNPYKIAKIRQDRYERAIEWLKGIMGGDVTIDGAPLMPEDELKNNSRWQIQADGLRPTLL